jgi:hypothetical protein
VHILSDREGNERSDETTTARDERVGGERRGPMRTNAVGPESWLVFRRDHVLLARVAGFSFL